MHLWQREPFQIDHECIYGNYQPVSHLNDLFIRIPTLFAKVLPAQQQSHQGGSIQDSVKCYQQDDPLQFQKMKAI